MVPVSIGGLGIDWGVARPAAGADDTAGAAGVATLAGAAHPAISSRANSPAMRFMG